MLLSLNDLSLTRSYQSQPHPSDNPSSSAVRCHGLGDLEMFPYICLLLKSNGEIELLGCYTFGSNLMWVKSVGEVNVSDPTYILGSDVFFNKWLRAFI